MGLEERWRDHEFLLEQASLLLGRPACAVHLGCDVRGLLEPRLRLEERRGLSTPWPILSVYRGRRSKGVAVGLSRYRLDLAGGTITLVEVDAPRNEPYALGLESFWAVAAADSRELYRAIRRLERAEPRTPPPVMRAGDRQRLWDNTLGFLLHGHTLLRRYGVARKRGVLLTGEPGNGKTTACRWLRDECQRRGLEWQTVTPQMYNEAQSGGSMDDLFSLDRSGVVLFDDFAAPLASGGEDLSRSQRTTFLTQLDGVETHEGVVFLFATNAEARELDPAFRRPGRIDLILSFPRPAAELRREFVERTWDADIRAAVDVDHVVVQTDGLSFAEMAELKKLLVLGYLERRQWSWEAAWQGFMAERLATARRATIGFHGEAARSDAAPTHQIGADAGGEPLPRAPPTHLAPSFVVQSRIKDPIRLVRMVNQMAC